VIREFANECDKRTAKKNVRETRSRPSFFNDVAYGSQKLMYPRSVHLEIIYFILHQKGEKRKNFSSDTSQKALKRHLT